MIKNVCLGMGTHLCLLLASWRAMGLCTHHSSLQTMASPIKAEISIYLWVETYIFKKQLDSVDLVKQHYSDTSFQHTWLSTYILLKSYTLGTPFIRKMRLLTGVPSLLKMCSRYLTVSPPYPWVWQSVLGNSHMPLLYLFRAVQYIVGW